MCSCALVTLAFFFIQVTAERVEEALQAFTDKYVLCSNCRLPELDADRSCRACGASASSKSKSKHKEGGKASKASKVSKRSKKDKNKDKSASAAAASASTTQDSSSDEETKGSDDDDGSKEHKVPGLDEFMSRLYTARDTYTSDKQQAAKLTAVDRLLDACWACKTSQAFDKIKADATAVLRILDVA
jgi:hypothetical protein